MKNLRSLRTELNMSQQQLADIFHISQQSIHKYETGASDPDITMLITMAEFFNTSVDYLVGNTDIRSIIIPDLDKRINNENINNEKINKEENDLLNKYRRLTTYHRKIVNLIINSYL